MKDWLTLFINNNDRKIQRLLEILPGAFSWTTILLFFVGSFFFPLYIAYLVVVFDVFWFYKSITFAATSIISYRKIEKAKKTDWLKKLKKLPNWKKVHHLIIVPQYKEPIRILKRTLESLKKQSLPLNQITVIMATEGRDPQGKTKALELKKEFGRFFANYLITVHQLTPAETAGKHSNENYAARTARKKIIDEKGIDFDFSLVTSADADHCFHPKHFSYLSFSFLTNKHRFLRFWQPAVFFYNNYWQLPALVRVANTFNTIWNGAVLSRRDRLISCQSYALSFRLLEETGYWNPKVIPEDYHLFFKAYYEKEGKIEVEPLFIPLWADAAQSTSTWKTIKNNYLQFMRWNWGISDDPNVIKNYLTIPTVNFWDKTIRLLKLLEDHLLMPLNWLLVTLGITIPALFMPDFSRTALGYTLPKVSGFILSLCLGFLIVIIYINAKQRPKRPKEVSFLRSLLIPLEFILMPLAGLLFSALPALEAHTRLMLGKYIEYRVTEKV